MKNVYIWLGTGVALCIIVGMVYLVGYTRGASHERDNYAAAQIDVIKTVEKGQEVASTVVNGADDNAVRVLLCANARGGCKRTGNTSDGM